MLAACNPEPDISKVPEKVSHSRRLVGRWLNGTALPATDNVAEEIPVAMVYNGISHAVMLATPSSLEQFGLGFSLAESIIDSPKDIYDTEIVPQKNGIELHMRISQESFSALKEKRRNLAGRTGCGLCGAESLQHVVRKPKSVHAGLQITPDALHHAFAQLPSLQHLQALTGAAHAAAWALQNGDILHIEEDIGRHNALDKLIGAMAMAKTPFDSGFTIITSRASYEMVQKAAAVGIPFLAAISAPTGLAIDLATQAGITLGGFTRNSSHVVYTHPQRLQTN